ncbi:hypothetical protein E4U57_000713 [Claviceps arundinis]|uniref:Lytic polysaccharide monooxygenase n=1 Tax=Claviceps arundinis TaxID=1623583 RepID=A0ABQ7PCU6_9HYPO|nr:hypothetical protein E4U57_000713 [Claviceps arundinis]
MNMLIKALVLAGLANLASAHMIMGNPVPFNKAGLSNGPLADSGVDFPCKFGSGYSPSPNDVSNVYPQGSKQTLKFIGQAVHGGGSCQVSLTTDLKPTKNSVWKVIKSIQGGCPAKNTAGNMGDNRDAADPFTYDFTIPKELASGNYTLAWTWFNKVGNREMYMNCAPVSVTGSGGSQTFLNGLPDMFVANIGNGCSTKESSDVAFPDPGKDVDNFGPSNMVLTPGSATSGNCKAPPPAAAAAAGGNGGASQPAASAAGQPKTDQNLQTGPTGSSPSAPAAPAASAAAADNVIKPSGLSTQPQSQCGMSGGAANAVVPASGSDSSNASSAVSPPKPAPPLSTSGSSSSSGSSGSASTAISAGSACSGDVWNCIGGTSYQRCVSGTWSAPQPVAGGTICTPGQGSTLKVSHAARSQRRFAPRGVRYYS